MADPQWLYDEDHTDSRPCFNAKGDTVVFMREGGVDGPGRLYTIPVPSQLPGTGTPKLLFPTIPGSNDDNATRPDWSWTNHRIAFSGAHSVVGPLVVERGLFLVDADGTNLDYIPIHGAGPIGNIEYPSWYPDGQHVAVTDYGNYRILHVDTASSPPGNAYELTKPDWILIGQSSVNQVDTNHLCMAAHCRAATGSPRSAAVAEGVGASRASMVTWLSQERQFQLVALQVTR